VSCRPVEGEVLAINRDPLHRLQVPHDAAGGRQGVLRFARSPDRLVDQATKQPYYVALVEAQPESLAKAGEIKLLAGMPAEVYIKGEERTPLQYLAEPVTQVLRHAGRER
jgi:multidrug efflux pump subunit AcrA (membrane-fusion protein)